MSTLNTILLIYLIGVAINIPIMHIKEAKEIIDKECGGIIDPKFLTGCMILCSWIITIPGGIAIIADTYDKLIDWAKDWIYTYQIVRRSYKIKKIRDRKLIK